MKLHELSPAPNSKKARKRVGRGVGSGSGKTSGRGHKGQNSRSGGGVRPGFEGGQMPIQRRLPKRGFSNFLFRKEYAEINVEVLNRFDENTTITPELLKKVGMVKNLKDGLKVLARGEIEKPVTVQAHKFSKVAVEKIEAAGGKAEVI